MFDSQTNIWFRISKQKLAARYAVSGLRKVQYIFLLLLDNIKKNS